MYEFNSQWNGGWQGSIARSILAIASVTAVVAGAGSAGFFYARSSTTQQAVPAETVAEIQSMFDLEGEALDEIKQGSTVQLDAFAGRIGALQAEILRLNALGERLAEMAGLDAEEFDFENPPPVGGLDDHIRGTEETSASEVVGDLTDIFWLVGDRKRKLVQLEQAIMEKELKEHATPSGWPVKSGYISSKFGFRRHPIYKKTRFHTGVDFASKRGTPVLATADGVVAFSGWQSGYGRLVEVRHMDGLVTRYAHNQKNLVEEGDLVEKGQTIARVGSSGRSTGPHVHFEVLKGGEAVNPLMYVGAKPPRTSG